MRPARAIKFIIIIFLLCGSIIRHDILFSQTKETFQHLEEYAQVNDSLLIKGKTTQVIENIGKSSHDELLKKDAEGLKCINTVQLAIAKAINRDNLNSESTTLFKKAIDYSQKVNRTDLEIFSLASYGYYQYFYNSKDEASKIFASLISKMERNLALPVHLKGVIYQRIAFFLSDIGDYQNGINYLKKSIELSPNYQTIKAASLDNLGNIFIKLNDLNVAEKYLKQALVIAHNINDENRLAKIYGNMGNLALKRGDMNTALNLIEKDIRISLEKKQYKNCIYAYLLQEQCYLKLKDLSNAEKSNDEIKKVGEISPSSYKMLEYDIVKNELSLVIAQNNEERELILRRMLDTLADRTSSFEKRPAVYNVALWKIQNLQYKIDQLKNKELHQKIKEQRQLLYISLLAFLAVVTLVTFTIRRRNKYKQLNFQRKISILSNEMSETEKKLNTTESTLTSYLRKKNQQIKALEEKITESENIYSDRIEMEKSKESIDKILQSHLMTDENWFKFRQHFSSQYPDYFNYLTSSFNDLNENNIKLIILLKLKLNNSEIGNLLGVSPQSIVKAKQRLKKKYGENYDALFKTPNKKHKNKR